MTDVSKSLNTPYCRTRFLEALATGAPTLKAGAEIEVPILNARDNHMAAAPLAAALVPETWVLLSQNRG